MNPFNPGRFADALDENLYARGLGKGSALRGERRRRARLLRKHKTAVALALATRLDGCRPRARCRSGACPECNYAAQQLYAQLLRDFLDKHRGSRTIAAVTTVPAQVIPPGNLSVSSHRRAVDRLKYALRLARVPWFVGGVDFTFNEHAEHRYPAAWCWHVHGFAPTKNIDRLKKRLKRRFPSTDAVPLPVKAIPWDGRSRGLRYALKGDFQRRVGRDDGQRFSRTKGTTRSCRITEKQRLRSREKRELLLHLDRSVSGDGCFSDALNLLRPGPGNRDATPETRQGVERGKVRSRRPRNLSKSGGGDGSLVRNFD